MKIHWAMATKCPFVIRARERMLGVPRIAIVKIKFTKKVECKHCRREIPLPKELEHACTVLDG